MEYCSETLNDRIHGKADSDSESRYTRELTFEAWETLNVAIDINSGMSQLVDPTGMGVELSEAINAAAPVNSRMPQLLDPMETGSNFDLSESDLQYYLAIFDDILSALIYIHDSGTVHRDLKPQNSNFSFFIVFIFLVLFSKADDCWKVADFGTASSATSSRQNTTHLSRGTASYRAPEILDSRRPKYNNKTDIFALGCIVYEIFTGEKLFWDDFAIVNYAAQGRLHESVWWPEATEGKTKCLSSLEPLVASMLENNYRKRPSARDIQKHLQDIRAGIGSKPVTSGLPIQVHLFIDLH